MRFRRTLIILPTILSLLCACQREAVPGQNPEAASLCLDLSVPGLRIESKGNVDNPFADDISSELSDLSPDRNCWSCSFHPYAR